jgi:hypothetical protein
MLGNEEAPLAAVSAHPLSTVLLLTLVVVVSMLGYNERQPLLLVRCSSIKGIHHPS